MVCWPNVLDAVGLDLTTYFQQTGTAFNNQLTSSGYKVLYMHLFYLS